MNPQNLSHSYAVRKLTEQDLPRLLTLCEQNPQYYRHCPPDASLSSLQEDMTALPPQKTVDDKYYIGFFDGDTLIAVMDLILQYPNEETAFIGFFMINAKNQGCGIGSQIISEVFSYLKQSFSSVRLGYVKGNKQAEQFWKKNGLDPTGVVTEEELYDIVVMERLL